jgi:hypothetical protein
MSSTTLAFAFAYLLLGIAGFVLTGSTHKTALIPCIFGLLFLVCGLLARKDNLRKHVMHAAVAAPPLRSEPAAQLPDTAVRPVAAQNMPAVHSVAAERLEEGQKLPAGHGVGARIAGCGQKLPEGQAVQDGDAALPME